MLQIVVIKPVLLNLKIVPSDLDSSKRIDKVKALVGLKAIGLRKL